MKTLTQTSFALAAIAAALTACGGGTTTTPTTSVSGSVVDGYLSGATVCVDVNKNGKCDAGEPTGTTDVNGAFTISGVTTADAAAAPLVAQVPSTAVDSDAPTTTVGSNFVLSTPAGKTVISPLTTLVHQTMLKDSTKTSDTAAADLKATVSSLATTTDVFADYVKGNDTNAHTAARVVANSLKANYDSVTAGNAGKDTQVAIALGEVAKQALMSQGTAPNAALPVGSEDPATLRAQIAAQTATAAGATQAVTINFDMVNGASTTVHCGDPITVTNTKRFDFSNATAVPVSLTTPTAQSTAGQLTDTRFYVANVVLIDANGNTTPLVLDDVPSYQSKAGGLALIDFGHNTAVATAPIACTTSYNTTLTGKVAPGSYTGISMTIGVPTRSADFSIKLNHTNAVDPTAPAPLTNADMAWSWQSGRKHVKIQFRPTAGLTTYAASTNAYVAASMTTDWNVHIGSTGCSGNPNPAAVNAAGNLIPATETACTNPNRLGLSFNAFNTSTQKIVLDIAQLLQNAELDFTYAAPPGCMSGSTDPDCAPIFKALGLDLATGKTLSGAGVQTVFSVK
ncbi:MbnP family copper-binding protein [Leptothrix ochracea]|uniref:MbnP family copper-binding protein n=1 Tax=Leptothrix ochracea TaxID=735331 RepID=UPI0034E1A836